MNPPDPSRWRAIAFTLAIVPGAFVVSAPAVQFTDATQAAGIAFEHRNSATPSKYLLETMGGGVALFDYDNDGRLDVFLTNGAKLDEARAEGKSPDKSDPVFWNRLYRQTGSGTFEDVTAKAAVNGAAQNQYGMGAAVGDYDNDGFMDLYVTSYGRNTLYRNMGNGTFSDVTERAGVGAGGSALAIGAGLVAGSGVSGSGSAAGVAGLSSRISGTFAGAGSGLR